MPTETPRSEPARPEHPVVTTYPFHYTDRDRTPCSYSGTPGWTEGSACPDGCDSARTHYSNDGHADCEDDFHEVVAAGDKLRERIATKAFR
jgi:hypothetical protein